jgi:two-component system, chemotaxis family, chemotaxis protein CheY
LTGGTVKILVAEDDYGSRRMMQKLLEPYGSVDIVVDGEEAVEAFQIACEEGSAPYDLVFMDIMMPKMDGHEALKRIRELERAIGVKPSNEVKVIMTSVLEDPKNVIEAYYGGSATSYLIKPIDHEKLEDELDRLGVRPCARPKTERKG